MMRRQHSNRLNEVFPGEQRALSSMKCHASILSVIRTSPHLNDVSLCLVGSIPGTFLRRKFAKLTEISQWSGGNACQIPLAPIDPLGAALNSASDSASQGFPMSLPASDVMLIHAKHACALYRICNLGFLQVFCIS